MSSRPTTIAEYIEAFTDFRDGLRSDEPSVDGLSAEDRAVVQRWTGHLETLEGVDSLPSLPSATALLDRATAVLDDWRRQDLAATVEEHLQRTVSPQANVTTNPVPSDVRAPWDLLATAHGLALRILVDADSPALTDAFERRAHDIAALFGGFPAEQTMVLVAINGTDHAVTVTRPDVSLAYETPSGEQQPPRPFGPVESLVSTCQRFFDESIVEFDAPPAPSAATIPDLVHVVEPRMLASEAVRRIAAAGQRAQIEEKTRGYGLVGEEHEDGLAALIGAAMDRPLDDYDARLARLGSAA